MVPAGNVPGIFGVWFACLHSSLSMECSYIWYLQEMFQEFLVCGLLACTRHSQWSGSRVACDMCPASCAFM